MTGRPAILFGLFAALESLEGVGPKTAKHLAQMDIFRPRDLVFTLPHSGIDRRRRETVQGVPAQTVVTVEVTVIRHMPPSQRGRPYRVVVEDAQTSFQLVFFHAREDWLKRQLPVGQRRLVSGKLEIFDHVAQIVHPDHMVPLSEADTIPDFEPVYALTAGVGAKTMVRAVQAAVARVPELAEWIDPPLREREGWPSFLEAVQRAHAPREAADLAPEAPARQRLAYD